jgi:methionyl aminopeptidase
MIAIRTAPELDLIGKSGEILKRCFLELEEVMRPGVSTAELDRLAERFIRSNGAEPAFKGYRGFPASICASINEQVVHGIPGPREIETGDIIGVDIGVRRNGYYSDACRTYAVGEIDGEAERLLTVTREALEIAIDKARPGNHLSDISHAIQVHAEGNGFQVVRALVGHGIGQNLHEEPQIPNFGPPGKGPALEVGMVLALEPMVNAGTHEVVTLKDNWTFVTKDGALSAHFEDTIAVTAEGPRILTR